MSCMLTPMLMILVGLIAGTGRASGQDVLDIDSSNDTAPLATSATPIADFIASQASALALGAQAQRQRPVAIDYSDAHETRATIHKYASWATLPRVPAY